MDFEETSNYHFLITATDSGFSALRDTAEVTIEVIDENDNVPEFTNRYVQYMVLLYFPTFLLHFMSNQSIMPIFNVEFLQKIVNCLQYYRSSQHILLGHSISL